MALPSSGAISLSDVNTNIGASSTAAITMNDTAVRLLSNGDTTTNPVTMSGLYGKSWVWSTNYSVGSTSACNSLTVDASGNVYATQLNLVVTKTNAVGVMQWATQLTGTSGYTAANSTSRSTIVVASSGNVYCSVRVYSNTSPFPYYYGVVKLNSSGVIQWSSFLSAPASYAAVMSIGIDSSENVYVANYNVQGVAPVDSGMCVAKYNTSGALQWQKRLSLVYGNSGSNCISVDATNNYVYLCGVVYDSSMYQIGGLLGKYDTNLSPVWQSLLSSGLRSYYGCAVNPTTQNVSVVTDYAGVMLYNSSGSVQWYSELTYASSIFYSVTTDVNGNTYYGYKSSSNNSICNKFDSSGNLTAQIAVSSATLSDTNAAPVFVSGSYLYSACSTSVATSGVVDGISVFKIPSALTTSGTYGRLTFAPQTYQTVNPRYYTYTTHSPTIVSTSFTEISGVLSGSNIASSYTKTVSAI